MQVLSNEKYYLALIIFIVILFYNVFYHISFHCELQSCIYPCKMYRGKTDREYLAILQGKLNMLNLPCKTVQDYPARLHAGYCAILQRVGYLARCCTQYIARYLARNIASCRQAFKHTHMTLQVEEEQTWGGLQCST